MVIVENLFVADEEQVFGLSLSNQEPVERIAVIARQKASSLSVIDGD